MEREMRTRSGDASAVAIVGEQIAAAIDEAAQNDLRSFGIAGEEELDALRVLSAALSASEDFSTSVSAVLARGAVRFWCDLVAPT